MFAEDFFDDLTLPERCAPEMHLESLLQVQRQDIAGCVAHEFLARRYIEQFASLLHDPKKPCLVGINWRDYAPGNEFSYFAQAVQVRQKLRHMHLAMDRLADRCLARISEICAIKVSRESHLKFGALHTGNFALINQQTHNILHLPPHRDPRPLLFTLVLATVGPSARLITYAPPSMVTRPSTHRDLVGSTVNHLDMNAGELIVHSGSMPFEIDCYDQETAVATFSFEGQIVDNKLWARS